MCEMRFLAPVKRSSDAIFLYPSPAIGQPQPRVCISAVINKGLPFLIGHQPLRQNEWLQQNPMLRPFIVESKSFVSMADKCDPARMLRPAFRLAAFGWIRSVPHSGLYRILEKRVFDVG